MIVTLNVLVDGEAHGELDFAFCACSTMLPEVKGVDINVVVATVGKKTNAMHNAPLCIAFVQ